MSENPTMPFTEAYAIPIAYTPDGAMHERFTSRLPIQRFSHSGPVDTIGECFGWSTALTVIDRTMRQQLAADTTVRVYPYYTVTVHLVIPAGNSHAQGLLSLINGQEATSMSLRDRKYLADMSPWNPHVERHYTLPEDEKPPLEPFVPPLPTQTTVAGQPDLHPDDAIVVEIATAWGRYKPGDAVGWFNTFQQHLPPTYASTLAISESYLEKLKQRVISTVACFADPDTAYPFSGTITELRVLRVTQRYYNSMMEHYTLEQIIMINLKHWTLVVELDDTPTEQEE